MVVPTSEQRPAVVHPLIVVEFVNCDPFSVPKGAIMVGEHCWYGYCHVSWILPNPHPAGVQPSVHDPPALVMPLLTKHVLTVAVGWDWLQVQFESWMFSQIGRLLTVDP